MVFEKIVRCPFCNTLNRNISHYCKECGSKVVQKSFEVEELVKILKKEVFEEREATDEEILNVKKIINYDPSLRPSLKEIKDEFSTI